TRSKAFFVVLSASRTTTEVRVLDTAKPAGALQVIAPREHDHEDYVSHRGGDFYIRTNSGGRNFRVVTPPLSSPGPDHWKEIVPHRSDVMIENIDLFRDFMVLSERRDALPVIAIVDLRSGKSRDVSAPEPVFEARADENREFDAKSYRFRYESP